MSYEAEPSSGSKTTLIIVCIVGGIILLIVLACGGLIFLIFQFAKPWVEMAQQLQKDMEQSRTVAASFLDNIRTDKLDAAYEVTTAAFKARMKRNEFDDLVKKNPELKQPAQVLGFDFQQGGGQPPQNPAAVFAGGMFRHRYKVEQDKKALEITVVIVKEQDALKVDQFELMPAGPPPVPPPARAPQPGAAPGGQPPAEQPPAPPKS